MARVLVAGVIGPDTGQVRFDPPNAPTLTCNSDLGDAYSGYRYLEIIDHFLQVGLDVVGQ